MKAKRLAALGLSLVMTMSLCGEVSAADIQVQPEDSIEAEVADEVTEDVQVLSDETDTEGESEDFTGEESDITVEEDTESEPEILTDDAGSEIAPAEEDFSSDSVGGDYQQGPYYYDVANGAATITSYNGTDRILNIPSSLGGYPVTEIMSSAFHPENNDNYTLEEVTIPDTVKTIGHYAFVGNNVLKKITIGKGATSIPATAFWGDEKLQSITVSSANPSYCTVGGILYNKAKTELVWVPIGITGNVTIQPGIKGIGEAQLSGRTEMTGLTLPEGIEYIDYSGISHCTKLTSITLPKSLVSIGYWAFNGCTSLSSVTMKSNVRYIRFMAFGDCPSLKTLVVPPSVGIMDNKCYGYIRGEAVDGSEDVKIEGLKICGAAGSAAETYAKNNGYAFEVVDFPEEEPETPNKGTTTVTPVPAKNNTASTTKAQTYTIKVNANGRKVTYKSSNRKVKVSKTGKVTIPKNFTGTVKITATAPKTKKYAKLTKTFTLTVKKAANTMKVLTKNQTVKAAAVKKKSKSFTIKVSKAQGKVTYRSSKSKYVTVSKKGKVVVKKGTPKGKYKITVTAAGKGIYGKKSKTLTVTVK